MVSATQRQAHRMFWFISGGGGPVSRRWKRPAMRPPLGGGAPVPGGRGGPPGV
jgi:hypothetical protein